MKGVRKAGNSVGLPIVHLQSFHPAASRLKREVIPPLLRKDGAPGTPYGHSRDDSFVYPTLAAQEWGTRRPNYLERECVQ